MAKAKFNTKSKLRRDSNRFVGDVRQSQLITSYGVGSIVNFIRDTVMIAGVDDWDIGKNADSLESRKIHNPNLQSLTGADYFIEPKVSVGSGWVKQKDVPAFVFPEMLYCPKCKRLVTAKESANANPKRPNRCCLVKQDSAPCNGTLVASRFVVVCENGHIEDFPYSWWIHGRSDCISSTSPRFSMYNVGDRSDIDSLFVKCDNCGRTRGMSGAFAPAAFGGENGYPCKGNHPHLKGKKKQNATDCDRLLKTRLRSSTGVYFSVTMGALSIPPWSHNAVKIILREYEALRYMPDPKPYLQSKVSSTVSISQLLEAYDIVKARKGSPLPRTEKDVYQDEYKVLSQGDSVGDEGEYSAFTAGIPTGFKRYFEQITVIDKLTVTEALVGFTRLKPWGGEYGVEDDGSRQLAPLSNSQKEWLPAVQLQGEGIFIRFREDALGKWEKRVLDRYDKMEKQLHKSYLKTRSDRFSPQYILLHTFSHLLIRQLANECGYSAASLKEKIYSTFLPKSSASVRMSGILIYLASSDCDGSLGGLIGIAQNPERLQAILENMVNKTAWCSGDPLCVTSIEQGFDSLNYSACHECALLPETSCEFRNVLLDRVSIVGTPSAPHLGIMRELLYSSDETEDMGNGNTDYNTPQIKVSELRHQLAGDYFDWDDASSLFDEHILQAMKESKAPLADWYDTGLIAGTQTVDALMLWEKRKLIVYESLPESDIRMLEAAGWICLDCADLTTGALTSAFGEVAYG